MHDDRLVQVGSYSVRFCTVHPGTRGLLGSSEGAISRSSARNQAVIFSGTGSASGGGTIFGYPG